MGWIVTIYFLFDSYTLPFISYPYNSKFWDTIFIFISRYLVQDIEKFPKDYAYQLTDADMEIMGSQNATPSEKQFGGTNASRSVKKVKNGK